MPTIKNSAQALEIAIRIERKGMVFYKYLSENVGSSKAKDVFSFLAAEEEKHIGVFRQLLEEVADYTPQYDYPGEYGLYIKEIAAMSIGLFRDYKASLKTVGAKDALLLGIQAELQTILFYTEFYNVLSEKHNKVIRKIIDEEKSHFIELKALLKKLNSKKGTV